MRQVTTNPIEPVNLTRHKLLLISSEQSEPFSFAISGTDLDKVIYSVPTKSSKLSLHSIEELNLLEESGFKIYTINQEDLKELCLMICASLTELDLASHYKKWLASKSKQEITVTDQ